LQEFLLAHTGSGDHPRRGFLNSFELPNDAIIGCNQLQ